jgi:two-component system sensor histidine kinase YesM
MKQKKNAMNKVSRNVRKLTSFKSLRVTMALSFIILMIVVYIVTYAVLSNKFEQTADENAIAFSGQIMEQLNLNLERYMEDMMKVSQYLSFQLYMKQFPSTEELNGMIKAIIDSRDDLVSIDIFSEDGELLYGRQDTLKLTANVKKQPWFILALSDRNKTFFSAPHVQNLFVGKYDWVVTLSKNISFYRMDQTTNGIMLIDVKIGAIDKMIRSVGMGERGYAYITDKYGNIIYHPHQQMIYVGLKNEDTNFVLSENDGSYISNIGGEKVITTIKTFGYTDWKLVEVIYEQDVISPQNEVTSFLWTIVSVSLAAIAIISVIISIFISRPVNKLEKSMKMVEQGNFDTEIHIKGDIEVEQLSNSFNVMVAKIKKLIDQNIKEHEETRKSELKALQFQIKPHFLYNTLESIIWMIEKGRNNEAVAMVSSLAKLFRIAINKGQEIISVRDELEHVKNYLVIQKMRYQDMLEYEIAAQEEVLNQTTLKLILQPLVENAIYHGIMKTMEKGSIRISVELNGGCILFSVQDNGVGIPAELQSKILAGEYKSDKGSSVGIRNIHERIRLYYGDGFGITIESVVDKGTEVNIRIPAQTEAPGGE